ncbi:cytosine permease [Gephyromycinifex aptenodytis]|uniref:cytosine permease n=1 Tax=Gephyromycinifex aptenodytis TaxID=2716227 RepID=UPI001445A6DF|nr:cytosine permease [Gephyromycinifex aptenodytis]
MSTSHSDTAVGPRDEDYAFEAVPLQARHGFWSVGFVMLGFTFFSASMSVGAKLGNGLDLGGYVLAVLLGGTFLAVYTGALAYLGARTGLSMDLIARRAFGEQGSYLPSALISLTQMGWFGVGVAMFAIPTAAILSVNPWVIVLVAGGLMTASAYFGIRAIEIVSYISVPLIAVLGTWSMISATHAGGGLAQVFGGATGMPLITAVGLVIGSFISGGTATPNFTRFAATPRSAVLTTVVAFLIGNTLMFSFGAVGGAFTGKDDIFYVMIAQGLALPAILVLGANIWTTNNNALYSSGLGFANITKAPRRPLVLLAGVVGTLSAMWLYDNFVSWLSFLSAALPPVGAIFIADFLRRRAAYDPAATTSPGVRIGAVIGVLLGGLAGWFLPFGVASINAMIIALVCYAIGDLVQGRTPVASGPRDLDDDDDLVEVTR